MAGRNHNSARGRLTKVKNTSRASYVFTIAVITCLM